jgi:hypothetical protein
MHARLATRDRSSALARRRLTRRLPRRRLATARARGADRHRPATARARRRAPRRARGRLARSRAAALRAGLLLLRHGARAPALRTRGAHARRAATGARPAGGRGLLPRRRRLPRSGGLPARRRLRLGGRLLARRRTPAARRARAAGRGRGGLLPRARRAGRARRRGRLRLPRLRPLLVDGACGDLLGPLRRPSLLLLRVLHVLVLPFSLCAPSFRHVRCDLLVVSWPASTCPQRARIMRSSHVCATSNGFDVGASTPPSRSIVTITRAPRATRSGRVNVPPSN